MSQKIVTIFGATGFIGRQVTRAFVDHGYVVRAVTRHAQKAYFLKVYGDVGQVVPMQASYGDPQSIDACVRGADVVVYLPGLLVGNANSFKRVHADYPAQIADAAARFHIPRYVHISALACDVSKSLYARTKLAGEAAVRAAYPNVTILRPSIVFGLEDGFFGRFAQMARLSPALPLIGGGHTKFQPVYVGDVAKAVFAAATLPDYGVQSPLGRVYQLGGPEIHTFKALLQKMFAETGKTRPLIPLPFICATLKAYFLQMLPVPPLTVDQVESLKTDNIVEAGSFGLMDLGIVPVALDTMLPTMLARYRAGGPAAEHKKVI